MIYEHAYVTVDPGNMGEFEKAFAGARKYLSDANQGKTAELIRSVDRPGVYLLRVGWDTVEQHTDEFSSSSNGALFADAVARYFIETPQVIHFESEAL
jgi:heme-degrading monooxygenase HmoA